MKASSALLTPKILFSRQEFERPTGATCLPGAVAPHLVAAQPLCDSNRGIVVTWFSKSQHAAERANSTVELLKGTHSDGARCPLSLNNPTNVFYLNTHHFQRSPVLFLYKFLNAHMIPERSKSKPSQSLAAAARLA